MYVCAKVEVTNVHRLFVRVKDFSLEVNALTYERADDDWTIRSVIPLSPGY